MKTYDPLAGEHVSETARVIVKLADQSKEPVTAKFNDIELTANPGDTAESIVKFFNTESERRHEAYVNSPEYKKRQQEWEEADRQKKAALALGLSECADKLTLRDEEFWKTTSAANSDGYGNAVIRYADKWARLMERAISKGKKLEECAEELSRMADDEGITGFMYGCAVGILAKCWIHGEELRRWHNLKTQLRDEGEKANESGGVLNPAILNIG